MARDESWWQSRTGLEQKLVILSTVLFILSFSLTISVIVIKNRTTSGGSDATTLSPTTVTGDVSTVTGETPVTEPTPSAGQSSTSDESPSSSQSTAASTPTTTKSTVSTSEPTSEATVSTSQASSKEPTVPKEKSSERRRSINARAVRYNPNVFANLNGDGQGA